MGHQPTRQVLGHGCLGVEHARAAQHGNEDLGLAYFARAGIDHRYFVAAVVDEHPGPRRVIEPHHHVLGPYPLVVVPAVLAIAPAVRVVLLPLQPQKPQRDVAATAQLAVHRPPLRQGPALRQLGGGRGEQLGLQGVVVHVVRQGPGQPGPVCPHQVLVHRGPCCAGAAGDLPDAQPRGLQPQDFVDLPHR